MSLLKRKSRPIARSELTYRDDRIFFVATDDTYAPKQYLEGLRISRVRVVVFECQDGDSFATDVVTKLQEAKKRLMKDSEVLEDDEFWIVADVDH